MVSLYDMMLQRDNFRHLSTSIPSLDSMLQNKLSSGIYDFESVPNCTGVSYVVGSIVVSHLAHKKENRAIIIDTLNPFPWHNIVKNEKFQAEWLDSKLISYTTDTFAKLFALLISDKLNGPKESTIVVINNFHELIEMYKLELSAAYEETLLKFQIDSNAVMINNQEKWKVEGSPPKLPEIPFLSSLLKENPALKYQSHVSTLINMISQYTYKNNLICILVGYLSSTYQAYRPKAPLSGGSGNDSQRMSSSSSSTPLSQGRPTLSYGTGRLVLTPSLGGSYTPTNSASGPNSRKSTSSTNTSLDSFITSRLIFYKDWYHKTPYFKENYPAQQSDTQTRLITSSQLKMIFAVKMAPLHQIGPESDPVYFDYDNGYYDDIDDENVKEDENNHIKIIDLSGPGLQSLDTGVLVSPAIQTHPVNSMSPNERESRDLNDALTDISVLHNERQRSLPSSPNMSESQINTLLPSSDAPSKGDVSQLNNTCLLDFRQNSEKEENGEENGEDSELIIDASDDDIMGSLLVNRVDSPLN